jgi:hypothetical protein
MALLAEDGRISLTLTIDMALLAEGGCLSPANLQV